LEWDDDASVNWHQHSLWGTSISLGVPYVNSVLTLDELDAETPEATEQWNRIARDNWMYTVSLFALSASPKGDVLALAGTCTLIAYESGHYILTAAHVWRKVLKGADKVGITLREIHDHTCLFEREAIVVSGPATMSSWTEWGPDVIFLRIPGCARR
jgi:hypothetical protein